MSDYAIKCDECGALYLRETYPEECLACDRRHARNARDKRRDDTTTFSNVTELLV